MNVQTLVGYCVFFPGVGAEDDDAPDNERVAINPTFFFHREDAQAAADALPEAWVGMINIEGML